MRSDEGRFGRRWRVAVLGCAKEKAPMPFVDVSSLRVIERLPGWQGRYFHSPSQTFAHYDFVRGASVHEFGMAYYHSTVNYTTLGYGDVIMSPKWRLLGPLEAANGILMFGVSTAMIFTLILRLTQARFADLKD